MIVLEASGCGGKALALYTSLAQQVVFVELIAH